MSPVDWEGKGNTKPDRRHETVEEKNARPLVVSVARDLARELTEEWSEVLQVRLEGAPPIMVFRTLTRATGVVSGMIREVWVVPGEVVEQPLMTVPSSEEVES